YFALKPSSIIQGKYLWTLVTHMFVHGGLIHLFFNMFTLYFLGSLAERIIGKKRFLRFYLISGVLVGILTATLSWYLGNTELGARVFGSPITPMVGASGAIFGVLGILAILIPKLKLYLIVGPLLVIILQFILNSAFPAISYMLNFISTALIFIMIFAMLSINPKLSKIALPIELPMWLAPLIAIIPLTILSFFIELPIGNVAHFGGFLIGIFYGIYLRSKYKRKIKILQRMFK
ncbi:MAG: rhomboid family intramembrane serine protease, partial [Nanoarchaeota archaeon]